MTRQELEDMLIRADEAGDHENAALFAEELAKLDSSMPSPEATQPTSDPRAEYDRLPMLQQAGTAVSDVLRLMSNGATFGFRDKGSALYDSYMNDRPYDEALRSQRAETDAARARAGSAAPASEVLGGVATGDAVSRAGLSLMERIPQTSMGFINRLMASIGAGAAEGGVMGGLDAAGNDKSVPQGIQNGLMTGAVAGPLAQGASQVMDRVAGRGLGNNPAPTLDELGQRVDAGYKALEDAGVQIKPEAVARLNQNIDANLTSSPSGPRRNSHPKIFGEIDALSKYSPSTQMPVTKSTRSEVNTDSLTNTTRSVNGRKPTTRVVDQQATSKGTRNSTVYNTSPDEGMSLYDLEQHRRAIRKSTKTAPDEQLFGNTAISTIDDFARGLQAGDITANPGVNVGDVVRDLGDTRALAHRELKLQEVGKEIRKGERSIDANDSRNPSDVFRGRIKGMLDSDKKVMGYTPDEVSKMEDIVKGTKIGNAARTVGKIAGSHVGSGVGVISGAGAGGLLAGPVGGTVGSALGLMGSAGVRAAASKIAESSTERQLRELLDLIARGKAAAPRVRPDALGPRGRGAVSRGLTLSGLED